MEKLNKLIDCEQIIQIQCLEWYNLKKKHDQIIEKYNNLIDEFNELKKRNEKLEKQLDQVKKVITS